VLIGLIFLTAHLSCHAVGHILKAPALIHQCGPRVRAFNLPSPPAGKAIGDYLSMSGVLGCSNNYQSLEEVEAEITRHSYLS
jgi:hypothetical protein